MEADTARVANRVNFYTCLRVAFDLKLVLNLNSIFQVREWVMVSKWPVITNFLFEYHLAGYFNLLA